MIAPWVSQQDDHTSSAKQSQASRAAPWQGAGSRAQFEEDPGGPGPPTSLQEIVQYAVDAPPAVAPRCDRTRWRRRGGGRENSGGPGPATSL
jgi:hypothetical protein